MGQEEINEKENALISRALMFIIMDMIEIIQEKKQFGEMTAQKVFGLKIIIDKFIQSGILDPDEDTFLMYELGNLENFMNRRVARSEIEETKKIFELS